MPIGASFSRGGRLTNRDLWIYPMGATRTDVNDDGNQPMIGLGCMRLSTAEDRESLEPTVVIQAALDSGARLLDTADAYCRDQSEAGHNERLIARALESWAGDRSSVEVATKAGLIRPDGRWVPDGRAKHLMAACEASLQALGVGAIDLYQLHVVDPKTPIETSVRALAKLQAQGLVRRIGLCNVTVGQIEAARAVAEIAAVQMSLSPFDDEALRSGVAEYCRDHGIRLLAYRPLGGPRVTRLMADPVLSEIASRHDATAAEIVLSWMVHLDPLMVPLPGATTERSARSIGRAQAIQLSGAELEALDRWQPAGRLLRIPRSARRPPPDASGEVVVVMGIPAAGKSGIAREFEEKGFGRLNRDDRGGAVRDLIPALEAGLARGERRWVLDNTYPTRRSRNEVIEAAWAHRVPVRCIWVRTDLANAQINAVRRMIEVLGRLPLPADLRERGRDDPRFFGPDAQFGYERILEPPVIDEGFTEIEERAFVRADPEASGGKALLLDFDLLAERVDRQGPVLEAEDLVISDVRRETLIRHQRDGWRLFAHAWRPGSGRSEDTRRAVRGCFDRARELLGIDIAFGWCDHEAGPPVCWCRKPLPGLVLEFVVSRGIPIDRCVAVGQGSADRTMARRLGARYREAAEFFGGRAT